MKNKVFNFTHEAVGFCITENNLSSSNVQRKIQKQITRISYVGIHLHSINVTYNFLKRLFSTKILFIEHERGDGSEDDCCHLVKALHEYRYIK